MVTVHHLLESKGRRICTIAPTATVYAALESMARENVGALVVVDQGAVVGILSERDYARGIILKNRASRSTKVEELMTREVCYVTPASSVEDCMAVMTEKKIRHLPVLDQGDLVGLVSIGDVVKHIIADREFTINELIKYISS